MKIDETYAHLKEKHPDMLLAFIDKYVVFYHEDAEIVARELDICLAKRQNRFLSGFSLSECGNFFSQLVTNGHKIAIVELRKAKNTKKQELVNMNVSELMSILECMDESAEVKIVIQPSWPLESKVHNVVSTEDLVATERGNLVYIVSGEFTDYGPRNAWDEV